MSIQEDLRANIQEFLESAEDDLRKKRFNSAIISFFKAIVVICDFQLYEKRRILPKNHNERFVLLKTYFPDAYPLVDFIFKTYTDAYNIRMREEDALLLREHVGKLKELFGI